MIQKAKLIMELQAVVKNANGNVLRVKSGKIEVSPILSVEFSIPAEGKTDKSVRVRTKGNSPLPIVWTLTKDGREVTISDFTKGELTNAGGDIRFTEQGIYTLTASVTDGLNRNFTAKQGINIYAAEKPIEKPDEQPNDDEQCPVSAPVSAENLEAPIESEAIIISEQITVE